MRIFHTFVLLLSLLVTPLSARAVPAEGQNIAVSGPSPHAVDTALKIYEMGGNAVDSAVAAALVLSVTSPYYAALGGGGFALISSENQTRVIDFRETAPKATHRTYYVTLPKEASRYGGTAVGVPGLPAGLFEMHKKYGKLHWSRLFDDAIRLAEKGFVVSGEWSQLTQKAHGYMNNHGKKHFLKKDEHLYLPGDKLVQPGLAKLLREMRNRGAVSFYEGAVAKDIIDAVTSAGGAMTTKDLQTYRPIWRNPITTMVGEHEVALMPLPSSGGHLIQAALTMMSLLEITKKTPLSADEFHTLGEIQRFVFRARSELADPAYHTAELRPLLGDIALAMAAEKFKLEKKMELPEPVPLQKYLERIEDEPTETTHISILTKDRGAVSMTLTLNGLYGSGVVTEKFGIALNNEMDDFTTLPEVPNLFGLIQGKANEVEPGKRPLSSMSPTLVLKDGKPVMSLGAPGGPRIINGVMQVLYRTLLLGWNIDDAIQAPRVHHQYLPDVLYTEPRKFSPEVLEALKAKGHKLDELFVARVYGAQMNKSGILEAAHDLRGEGDSKAR
jgi:gamma-glutamyltranspeptidase/glutathione hydrolase